MSTAPQPLSADEIASFREPWTPGDLDLWSGESVRHLSERFLATLDLLTAERDSANETTQHIATDRDDALENLALADAVLATERARGERLVSLLWLCHGHRGLYGDDGEMQCGVCVLDFKRASLDRIAQVLLAAPALPEADAEPEPADQATTATAAQASPKAQGE